jgi:lipopolysaccharide biosynthesis glycosyltransferase
MIDVCCAAEGDYVVHSAAMLHSVVAESGPDKVRITYLHPPEFPFSARDPLREMVERGGGSISFVEVPDERCEGLPITGFTGKATWYRALAPELLPDKGRVLFLDCDLLALDSVDSVWETDVSDHFVAAVTNVFQLDHLHRPAELGLDMPQCYFNAGVLLMNLDLMRQERCTQALLEYGRANRRDLMFRDQDALNVVLAKRRLALHPRWNCMNSVMCFPWAVYVFGRKATEEACRNPGIRHFEGPGVNKPWHVLCEQPLRETYFQHRSQTPWPRVRLDGEPRPLASRMAKQMKRRLRRLGRLHNRDDERGSGRAR